MPNYHSPGRPVIAGSGRARTGMLADTARPNINALNRFA